METWGPTLIYKNGTKSDNCRKLKKKKNFGTTLVHRVIQAKTPIALKDNRSY